MTDTIINESVEDSGVDSDAAGAGVKALSGKTDAEIKKMMETFREQHAVQASNSPFDLDLYNDFSEILSTEGLGTVN